MHDTDRTLAELTALELDMEGEFEDENLESPAAFEYEAEADAEALEVMSELGQAPADTSPAFEGVVRVEREGEWEGEGESEWAGEAEGEWAAESESEDELLGEGEFEGEGESLAASELEGEDEFEDEGEGEFVGEGELTNEAEFESRDEVAEAELAAELLEVQSEAELEYFLGGVIKAAAQKIGTTLAGGEGKKLLALLKGAAKKVLPVAGAAVGGFFGGPAGAALGGNLAGQAGKVFGLELEGLAAEDREFETAKGFIRFATDAARNTAQLAPEMEAELSARRGFLRAARRFAPGLLSGAPLSAPVGTGGCRCGSRGRSRRGTGRWVRVGRHQLVLYGL